MYYHLRVNRKEIVSVAIGGVQPNLSKEIIENINILEPKQSILKIHPFEEIISYREKLTREISSLAKTKNLLLSKMTKI